MHVLSDDGNCHATSSDGSHHWETALRSSLYKGLVNQAPLFRLSYCPPSFPLYWFLFLLPLLPGTLGEREGERESQRIDRGKGSANSLLSKESRIKILNSRTLCIERISRLAKGAKGTKGMSQRQTTHSSFSPPLLAQL